MSLPESLHSGYFLSRSKRVVPARGESAGNLRNSMIRPPLVTGGETGHGDRPVAAAYSAVRPLCSCAASFTAFSRVLNCARFSAERRATIPVWYRWRPNRIGAGPGRAAGMDASLPPRLQSAKWGSRPRPRVRSAVDFKRIAQAGGVARDDLPSSSECDDKGALVVGMVPTSMA